MKQNRKNNKGFLSLLGLLFALAIMCVLVYFVFRVYFGTHPQQEGLDGLSSDGGLDITNYKSTLDSARKTVSDINKEQEERMKQLEGF